MANLAFTMQTIRQQVKRCTPSGCGFTACCPAHDDAKPSFSFAVKGDRVVIHCQAGCSPESILDRLGLGWPDLFDDNARRKYRVKPSRPEPSARKDKDDGPPTDYGPLLDAARK